jgi:uroporphyrinogen decarboxylase
MDHRERLQACLSGVAPDRTPVALWRHFPVDDQSPESLAAATIEFQKTYDFDLVKVTPASSFCLKDWGVRDEWQGNTEGTRTYTRSVIEHPEDWARLALLDPQHGYLAQQLECLRLIRGALPDTPIIQTIFSPLSQAKNLVGKEALLVHLRRNPQAVRTGLERITTSTVRFVEAALATGIDGIFYAVQHAQYGLLSEQEYARVAREDDLAVLEASREGWLRLLHLHGQQVMFDFFLDYPVNIINWHDRETPPDLQQAQTRFGGVVCGGLRQWDTMVLGDPEQVRQEGRQAIERTGGIRFLLGTGCVTPIIAPRANILAARQVVEA